MDSSLGQFEWSVDEDGYAVEQRPLHGREVEVFTRRGGPWRYYRPLENDAFWLSFAETCRTREGVLRFVAEFGLLHTGGNATGNDPVGLFIALARRLWAVGERVNAGDRRAAVALWLDRRMSDQQIEEPETYIWPFPQMVETIVESAERPDEFKRASLPRTLEDALKHQAALAIEGNPRFRRCRNPVCENWFRLAPRVASGGGRNYTVRRKFCSTRCRVAWARRTKQRAVHA
jgi:hypothetical protein